MEQKIRLSQCMIVKNEEKNIERALSWGKDVMWEQIVVDTGSTDQTVAVAERLGAKVFHFPWIDDFSAAKNYAIEQAKGDWIVFLDADEYFLPEDVEKLLPLLEGWQHSAYQAVISGWIQVEKDADVLKGRKEGKLEWLQTVREDGSSGLSLAGTQVRIFRNQPGLRYQGRIHESLVTDQGPVSCVDASRELSVLHTGYSAEEMQGKKKTERNIALLKQELMEHPGDYKILVCLGDSYFQQKDYPEAARWYEKAASCFPASPVQETIQGAMIFKHLLLIYMDIPDEEAVMRSYRKGTACFPKDADYDYLTGRDFALRGHYKEGADHLQRALVLLEQYGSESRSALLSHNLLEAWELLIRCHNENGELNQCVSCAVTVLKAAPYRIEPLKQLLLAFQKEGQASGLQIKAFLGNFYDFQKEEDREFVKTAAQEIIYGESCRDWNSRL
ncbi:MAG: glycosyltransferase [Lachnospiraceae bacterium]|nr:glycosyltransferase [Lachnospiraceae bacterium]